MPRVMDVKRIQYKPPVGEGGGHGKKGAVCRYWLQGRCTKNPCRFVHGEVPKPTNYTYQRAHPSQQTSNQPFHAARPNYKKSSVLTSGGGGTTNNGDGTLIKNPLLEPKQSLSLMNVGYGAEESGIAKHSYKNSDPEPQESSFLTSTGDAISQKDTQQSMILGTCNDGDKHENSNPQPQDSSFLTSTCDAISKHDSRQSMINGDEGQCLNSWFMGDGFWKIAQLEGHNKAVTGIALPQGSDKLYTGSGDGVFRVWDCHTGQCVSELSLGSEIGCLISDGPWIFIGLRNLVKVWNTQTSAEYSLEGPVGQVFALETSDKDMLFAGMQDGSILAWKYNPETNAFQFVTTLKGHSCGVLSLKVGRQSLYSGSMDSTIRRWDLDTLQCVQTLTGHSAAVTSLLCWDNYLLSCSLDQTIKAWAYTKNGCLEVIHTHKEEHGVVALFGMHDADKKPILFCSCNDKSVHLYELPLFRVRGKIYGKQEVRTMESGAGEGLFFTGEGAGGGGGGVAVWKWLSQAQTAEKDCPR